VFICQCAEYGGENDFRLCFVIENGSMFNDQKGREYSVTNCLSQALAYDDSRPEAYLLYRNFTNEAVTGKSATPSSMGLNWSFDDEPFVHRCWLLRLLLLRFDGRFVAWWISRKNESFAILQSLPNRSALCNAVQSNLEKLNAGI
jgi:hypothetical protein